MSEAQVDIFLDSILDAPVKDERALMEFPFFALTKRARTTPFVYDDGAVRIEIQPGHKGIATIWDKDVLIYCASIINDRIERRLPVEPKLRFSAYEFLKLTSRSTSARGYDLFLDALDRLQSTAVKTTITSGHEEIQERRGFSWIDKYRVITRKTKTGRRIMIAVELTINEWLWRALVENRRVLTINRDYFHLSMGLERRLYELARKHCGYQEAWRIGLARLAEKCGSSRGLKQFKSEINKIITRDSLPDYRLMFEADRPAREGLAGLITVVVPRTGLAKRAEDAALIPPSVENIESRLSLRPKTLAKARDNYPGYDIDGLVRAWRDWTVGTGEKLHDVDKAFLAFCNRYTANHPLLI